MSQVKIQKNNKRSSLQNPYFINNIFLNDEKGNDLNPNDKETKSKPKKVKFSTDKIYFKTDFDFANLSPSKNNIKNSILKTSKQNNIKKLDDGSKQLSQKNLFEETNNNFDNKIPPIINNLINKINNSESNLIRINKDNNKHIFYPLLDINNMKNKEKLPNNNSKNEKYQFMNIILEGNKSKSSMLLKYNNNKTHNIINGINFKSVDNKYRANSNFSNNLFPTSINEIYNKNININKNKIKFGDLNENTKYNKTESNFYSKRKKLKTKKSKTDIFNALNTPLLLKFKDYQKI